MMLKAAGFVGLTVALSLAACGGDDEADNPGSAGSSGAGTAGSTSSGGAAGGSAGSGGSSATVVDEETFPAEYAKRFCAAQELCCDDAGGEVAADCEESVTEAVADTLADRLSGEHREFWTERAEACLEALAGAESCSTVWLSSAPACSNVVNGTLEGGEPCEAVEDCVQPEAGFAGCAELGGETEKRCRSFDATAGVGDDCFDHRGMPFDGDEGAVTICGDGLFCVDGKCVQGAALEESCADVSCADGLCLDGTCQELSRGDECTTELDTPPCELSTLCTDGTCEQRPLLEQVANQETCSLP